MIAYQIGRYRMSNFKLDSWKQIAAYLEREVRTVQRWEREEGLPVHRHSHVARGSVYALKNEIDAWRESRRDLHLRAEDPSGVIPFLGSAEEQKGPRRERVVIACLLFVLLILAGIGMNWKRTAGLDNRPPVAGNPASSQSAVSRRSSEPLKSTRNPANPKQPENPPQPANPPQPQ